MNKYLNFIKKIDFIFYIFTNYTFIIITTYKMSHKYELIVAGDLRERRVDKRVKNIKLRTNVTIDKKSTYIPKIDGKRIMDGTYYTPYRKCSTCKQIYSKDMFENFAIREEIRKENGLNIHCRECQKIQHTKSGYKLGEDFIVGDNEETGYYPSDSDEEEFVEKDEDTDDDTDNDTAEESEGLYDTDTDEESKEEDEDLYDTDEETDDEDKEYEVENIIKHKYTKHGMLFKVKWLGYDETTYEPASSLTHVDIFQRYICINEDLYSLRSKEFRRPKFN